MFQEPRAVVILVVVLQVALAREGSRDWDLAVVIRDKIELLASNGTTVDSAIQESSILKALTYDSVRQQFIVSGMDQSNDASSEEYIPQRNDTIFTVQLTKETDDVTAILQDLPDDVQGLSIDPITDTLFWTNPSNKTINYVSLTNNNSSSQVFLEFSDKRPQDITVDICERYVYWTNSNPDNATIERASLNGSKSEIIVSKNLVKPYGITVDHYSKRLYWADMGEGIYYRIESSDLDGNNRAVVYDKGIHTKPFGIAVDAQYVYWTDVTNNALWRIKKHSRNNLEAEKIRDFPDKPMGIVAKNFDIQDLPDCNRLSEAVEDYNHNHNNKAASESEPNHHGVNNETVAVVCLNGGRKFTNEKQFESCSCSRGFTGRNCEISLCHNFCVNGECSVTYGGSTKCKCWPDFGGERCERNVCEGFCLNGGECRFDQLVSKTPRCSCPDGFAGPRCEKNYDIEHICSMFCEGKENDILVSRHTAFLCRCERGAYTILENSNGTSEMFKSAQDPLSEHFRDPAFLILSCIMLIMIFVVLILTYSVCNLRRRPKIKKRIIVNKNVTPLTYRPQPNSEHCEITIENCCNMNVCETPCFEPPKLRGFNPPNEDKKKLLSHMENNDHLY